MLVREKKILFVLSSISITWQQAVPMVYELMYYAYIRPMKNFNIPFFFSCILVFYGWYCTLAYPYNIPPKMY